MSEPAATAKTILKPEYTETTEEMLLPADSGQQGIVLASGNPSGFTFEAQGTQHVLYTTPTGGLHELYWDSAGWHDTDAFTEARAGYIAAAGDPCGYMFVGQGSLHAVFLGGDKNIYELYRFATTEWKYTNLTVFAGAPAAAGNPFGYVFEAQGTQHAVYRAKDGNIHELYWQNGVWSHTAAAAVAGAPDAVGDPIGYVFDAQGTQHVLYRAGDKHIHELYWDAQGWHHHDPTGDNGAPDAAGDPTGYALPEGSQHVFYRGTDSHIYELQWRAGLWSHADLTNATGAPKATGDPSSYVFAAQGTQHVMFRAADNHIHELYWQGGAWHHHDPTGDNQAPKTDGDPSGYMFNAQTTQHVVYCGADSHVHELYWQGGNWAHTDASYDARLLPPDAPSGLRVTGIVDRGIFLAWTDNSNNETGFRLTYDGKQAGSADHTGTMVVDPNFNSTSIGGLRSNFNYTITVLAFNGAGDSGSSNAVTATTPARTINAVKQAGANTTLAVTGRGFSPNLLIVIETKSGSGQTYQFQANASPSGSLSTTISFICQGGTTIAVLAFEDADPIGTMSNIVSLVC